MLKPLYAGQFKKDIRKIEKSGDKDMERLKSVVRTLIEGSPLESKYRDHSLTGDLKGHRDCHLGPDWILIYRIDRDAQEIVFVRTGSHADLFG